MASAEELLATLATSKNGGIDYITIDPLTRDVDIPLSQKLFGIYLDLNVTKRWFKCPRFVGKGLDLSECNIFINYISASGESGSIQATDVSLNTDDTLVVFSWTITPEVIDKNINGTIVFAIQAIKMNNGVPQEAFATRPTQATCGSTVEPGDRADVPYPGGSYTPVDSYTKDQINQILTEYVTRAYLAGVLDDKVDSDDITTLMNQFNTALSNKANSTDLTKYVTNERLTEALSDIPTTQIDTYTKAQIDSMVSDYITKTYFSDTLATYVTKEELNDAIVEVSGETIELLNLDGAVNGSYACQFSAGSTYLITNNSGMKVSCHTRINKYDKEPTEVINKELKSGDTIVFVPTVDANWVYAFTQAENLKFTVVQEGVNDQSRIIEEIREEIRKLSGGVPEYFLDDLTAAETRIKENMMAAGRNGDTFVFITDLHWEQNAKNSPALVQHILDHLNINTVVCGGDMIGQATKEEASDAMVSCVKAFDFKNSVFLPVIGNHDSNWNTDGDQREHPERHFDLNNMYALMGKQTENVAVQFGTNTMNYYVDKPTARTRYILLDTGEETSSFSEFQELVDCLLATPEGYHVVVVAHIVTSSTWINKVQPILDACNARESVTVNSTNYDLSSAKCSVVISLGGHTHQDEDTNTTGGIPVVVTDTDSSRTHYPAGYLKGTVTEQAFDVVTLNYTAGTAKFIRIGRGTDRAFVIPGVSEYVPGPIEQQRAAVTKTSQLENDSGFVDADTVYTKQQIDKLAETLLGSIGGIGGGTGSADKWEKIDTIQMRNEEIAIKFAKVADWKKIIVVYKRPYNNSLTGSAWLYIDGGDTDSRVSTTNYKQAYNVYVMNAEDYDLAYYEVHTSNNEKTLSGVTRSMFLHVEPDAESHYQMYLPASAVDGTGAMNIWGVRR